MKIEQKPVYLRDELEAIRGLKLDINYWDRRIEQMGSAASRTTARIRIGNRGQTTTDCVGDAAAAIMDMRDKVLVKKATWWARILEIEDYVDRQKSNYRQVLRLRYFENMRWKAIAAVMGYNIRQCMRIHSYALEEIRYTTINCHTMSHQQGVQLPL